MRAILAYFLLLFYTITCAGATVYMHECQGDSLLTIEKSQNNAGETVCPLCPDEDSEKEEAPAIDCHSQTENCCTTVVVDLHKKEKDAEQTLGASFFFSLSPVSIIRYWVLNINPIVQDKLHTNSYNSPNLLASSAPPVYLVCCNFRI